MPKLCRPSLPQGTLAGLHSDHCHGNCPSPPCNRQPLCCVCGSLYLALILCAVSRHWHASYTLLLPVVGPMLVIPIFCSLSLTSTPPHPSFSPQSLSFIPLPSHARHLDPSLAIVNSYTRIRSRWYASHHRHARSRPFLARPTTLFPAISA
jgi:hypothetical protein